MTTDSGDHQRQLLAALATASVDFIVIGEHAVAAHGYARATRDVDIVFASSSANCERLAGVLTQLDAKIVVADVPPRDGEITGAWLSGGGQFIFRTCHGLLEACSWIAGKDHAALAPSAIAVNLADGTSLRVCGYDDLVALKQIAGRSKDEEDLRNLRDLHGDH